LGLVLSSQFPLFYDESTQLLAKLKMNGFGGNVFSADDLKNMSPEEMSQKVS
jgi:hypothetical protein